MEKSDKKVKAEEWKARFAALGVDDNMMAHWHTLFERENPSGYESFQEWLCLPEERMDMIRSKSEESKK